jgi:copper transporter 1
MVAVMTMNVGYLLSILAGVFVGSMIFGRFMAYSVAH